MQNKKPRCLAVPSALRRHRWMMVGTLLGVVLIVGCARQYHWYRCGCDCVNYNDCSPVPLPHTPYCSCPTPVSNSFHGLLQAESTSSEILPESSRRRHDTASVRQQSLAQ